MDLSSTEYEFAFAWLQKNLIPQPPDSKSLTWFVGANHLYMAYANAAMRADAVPISFFEVWEMLNMVMPAVKAGKLMGKLPVYFRLRYIPTGIPEFGL